MRTFKFGLGRSKRKRTRPRSDDYYLRLFVPDGCMAMIRSASKNKYKIIFSSLVPSNIMGVATPAWTREQVAARILAGETIIILRDKVVRVPQAWLASHPGGSLAILHFVGRDASDEVEAFHSDETLKRMRAHIVGTLDVGETGWTPLVPPITTGWVRRLGKNGSPEWHNEASEMRPTEDTELSPASQILLVKKREQGAGSADTEGPALANLELPPTRLSAKVAAQHSNAYKTLHKRVVDAGLYDTPYITGYGPEIIRYTLLAACSALAYRRDWLVVSAVLLGMFWQQLTFFAHDLGHNGVTHNWTYDRILGIFIADLVGGLSIGWWVDVSDISLAYRRAGSDIIRQNHNVHHCTCVFLLFIRSKY